MAIDQKNIFMDDRLRQYNCIYCGGLSETREHIPPKIFLDSPHPEDLPVVPACRICNNQKSLDEEYLACLIECVICGTTDISKIEREKVKKALSHSPKLQFKIENAKHVTGNGLTWTFDRDRVNSIALKLAQGHMVYELYAMMDEPIETYISPLCTLPPSMTNLFSLESCWGELDAWPELGSRAFLRAVIATSPEASVFTPSWIVIQEGRYRYKVIDHPPSVTVVIREYLGIHVAWE